MTEDKKEELYDELEETEEDREFYRLHSDPEQMRIDHAILGRMAPISYMDKEDVEELVTTKNTEMTENVNNIFQMNGIVYTASEEDLEEK